MSNHNYSQYSNNKKKKNYNKPKNDEVVEQMSTVEDEVVSDVVTTVEAPVEPAEIKMAVETVETVTLPASVTGTVFNCSKLNVRVKPAIDAEVVTLLNNDSKVEIDPARSTSDWFKITTAAGVEGYCMRKFVNAKL